METRQGVINRRSTKISGIGFIRGGKVNFPYQAATSAEECPSLFVDDDEMTAEQHYIEACNARSRKLAKAKLNFGSSTGEDSFFVTVRNLFKSLKAAYAGDANMTDEKIAEKLFAMNPDWKDRLKAEGVEFFADGAKMGEDPEDSGDESDDDED